MATLQRAGTKGTDIQVYIGKISTTTQTVSVTVDKTENYILTVSGDKFTPKLSDVYFFTDNDSNLYDYFVCDDDEGLAIATAGNPTTAFMQGTTYTGAAAAVELMPLCVTANSVTPAGVEFEEETNSCSSVGGYPYSYGSLTAGDISLTVRFDACDDAQDFLRQALISQEDFILQYRDYKCGKAWTFVVSVSDFPFSADDMAGYYSSDITMRVKALYVYTDL